MNIFFDKEIQTNLYNITELVLNIFDATGCSIVIETPQSPIELCQHGSKITLTKDDLVNDILNESIINGTSLGISGDPLNVNPKIFKVVAPIILPSKLKFGWLVFERQSDFLLTKKETLILSTLQKNIVNQLVQQSSMLEKTKELELHSMISKLNTDFIFIKNENFKFIYINDAFKGIYPKKMQSKIIGSTTIEDYDDDEARIFLTQDKIALDSGISKIVESLHLPNGSHIIVETIKQRFEDNSGKRYILGVCRDITEKENLITKLQKANSELDEFTSIASHDLKSPLNAIKRLLEWISDDCKNLLPEEHLENFQLVINRTNRMQVLLEDLLSYSKINSCDSTRVSMSLISIYSDVAEALEIPSNVTVNLNTNNELLNIPAIPFKTVFQNLICNAIKHNDKKHSVINISLLPSQDYYIIKITDNGPGIDPKYFSLIFKLFQTLQSRDDIEGSGIGLCIANKLIVNYGGKIEVASDGKLGSTFTIYWPKI
ncbi:ATP-binding protein [Pseudoalteromonas sp. TB64]|uniref:sensor histidine kinase n=1 Tax=Pseudoalteromonas sp. TB64 TaxID=1938600 RepID=UPI0004083EF4|nr:ATP-binding protein [Pseudoalteromonas sp. TB64]